MNNKDMVISDISGNIIDEPPLLEGYSYFISIVFRFGD